MKRFIVKVKAIESWMNQQMKTYCIHNNWLGKLSIIKELFT